MKSSKESAKAYFLKVEKDLEIEEALDWVFFTEEPQAPALIGEYMNALVQWTIADREG